MRQRARRIQRLGREVHSQFIYAEMAFALTLADLAVSQGEEHLPARSLRSMETAYAAVRQAMPHAALTHSEKASVLEDLRELKAQMIVLNARRQ
jgi:hypothetical protein